MGALYADAAMKVIAGLEAKLAEANSDRDAGEMARRVIKQDIEKRLGVRTPGCHGSIWGPVFDAISSLFQRAEAHERDHRAMEALRKIARRGNGVFIEYDTDFDSRDEKQTWLASDYDKFPITKGGDPADVILALAEQQPKENGEVTE